jgi:lipopolysaccharide/colanic/teichoic acid biosynthesis glycosyltransferase
MLKNIQDKFGIEVIDYISSFIDVNDTKNLYISTTNSFNIVNSNVEINNIINFTKVNNLRYMNQFFIAINTALKNDHLYIGVAETIAGRQERKRKKYPRFIAKIIFIFEFIFLRVFPKVSGLKKIYFFVTRGRNRLISKAELLGRLISCGFSIVDFKTIENKLYFVVKKTGLPIENQKPSYGLLYTMPRVGKNGKMIGVYKFRTMHPYSEFLHSYILEKNGYAASGKPADDFRLTPWGKFLRKYWLDELPQLLNVLKGDLKLVGIRPVGLRYLQDIPEDLRELRSKHKPGCIPPYVAFNKGSNVDSVQDAEREYLIKKNKNPYFTDTICFFKAIWNIVVRKKRSA